MLSMCWPLRLHLAGNLGALAGNGIFYSLELLQELLTPGQGAGLAFGASSTALRCLARHTRDFAGAFGLGRQLALPEGRGLRVRPQGRPWGR